MFYAISPFENIMQKKHLFLIKKQLHIFLLKTVAYQKKETEDPRKNSTTKNSKEDPKMDPITENSIRNYITQGPKQNPITKNYQELQVPQ